MVQQQQQYDHALWRGPGYTASAFVILQDIQELTFNYAIDETLHHLTSSNSLFDERASHVHLAA